MAKLVEIVLALLTEALLLQQQPSSLGRRHFGVLKYMQDEEACSERDAGVKGSPKRCLRRSREVGCDEKSLEGRNGIGRGGLHWGVSLF